MYSFLSTFIHQLTVIKKECVPEILNLVVAFAAINWKRHTLMPTSDFFYKPCICRHESKKYTTPNHFQVTTENSSYYWKKNNNGLIVTIKANTQQKAKDFMWIMECKP